MTQADITVVTESQLPVIVELYNQVFRPPESENYFRRRFQGRYNVLAMLASLGGCAAQLAGHVAANLAAGNDRKTLLAVVTQLLPFIGYPRTLNAIRVISEGTSP